MLTEAKVAWFENGIVIQDEWPNDRCKSLIKLWSDVYHLIIGDPPYGNVVKDYWDKFGQASDLAELQVKQCYWLEDISTPGGALYWFGGYGEPGFRPYYQWLIEVERMTNWRVAMPIVWKKKRAYGVKHNYIAAQELFAYCCLGDIKKPRLFNIPYTNELRGYAGFNKKYPAKSPYKRRTPVWSDVKTTEVVWHDVCDVTEILRGKLHTCHKPAELVKIPIEVHTDPGEFVLDLFSGSGEVAVQANAMGRKFASVERDPEIWQKIVDRLGTPKEITHYGKDNMATASSCA